MQLLDGKAVAQKWRGQIRDQVEQFERHSGTKMGLAVVLIGEDAASQVYVANKIKACGEVGIISHEVRLSAGVSVEELRGQIDRLNHESQVHGILVQLPLPGKFQTHEIIECIDPKKDADCLTTLNMGRLWAGRPLTQPCTPAGVMAILEHYQISVSGMNAVVIGRSQIVGKPMAHLLSQADATVTICHSRTKNLSTITRAADLVVVAAGKANMLGAGDFKNDSVVVDVGIHRVDGIQGKVRLCGDVRAHELSGIVRAITPVPGGVGPMTITMLLANTVRLANARLLGFS